MLHPCRSCGSCCLYKFGRTKHCSVRYKKVLSYRNMAQQNNIKHVMCCEFKSVENFLHYWKPCYLWIRQGKLRNEKTATSCHYSLYEFIFVTALTAIYFLTNTIPNFILVKNFASNFQRLGLALSFHLLTLCQYSYIIYLCYVRLLRVNLVVMNK